MLFSDTCECVKLAYDYKLPVRVLFMLSQALENGKLLNQTVTTMHR